jgi:hypothetical protein
MAQLFESNRDQDRLDGPSRIAPLTPSGLIRNRAGAAPQSIRSEESLDLSIRPIEGYADSVGKVGFPMFPEDSLKRLELLSQGFNAHGVSPAFLPISCDANRRLSALACWTAFYLLGLSNKPVLSLRKRAPQCKHHRFRLSRNRSQLTGGKHHPNTKRRALEPSRLQLGDLHNGHVTSLSPI